MLAGLDREPERGIGKGRFLPRGFCSGTFDDEEEEDGFMQACVRVILTGCLCTVHIYIRYITSSSSF